MKRSDAGLLRGGFRFNEHINLLPPSKNPNAAAVIRGHGSLALAFNSIRFSGPLPALPDNPWGVPAMKRGLRDALRAQESKWP